MIPLKIVHIPRFRSTRAVWMYFELKEIYGDKLPPLEITTFTDIAAFRSSKPQWLLDLNPNGKVPTMSHGSIVMFEGGAICSYLLDQFDINRLLLPRDPLAVSLYYMFVSWCASTIDNLTATSSPINIVLTPQQQQQRPMDDVDTNLKYFEEIVAPYLNKQLHQSGGPYLCGERFTAVDVIVGYCVMQAAEKMQPAWIVEDKHPELFHYLKTLQLRPAMQSAITIPN